MPELPEVETVRRALDPRLVGHHITSVEQRRPDLRFPFPQDFTARLTGRRVEAVRRRAKYLLAELDTAETLVVHLGMSGRITLSTPNGRNQATARFHQATEGLDALGKAPHDHVVFDLDDGTRVVFNDHRRFGFMDLVANDKLFHHKHFVGLGPEPLGNTFSHAHLDDTLKTKSTPIKTALLDQRVVAGLGNIYVCEALHRARISPKRLARSIPGVRAARLAPAIRSVLEEAICAGGSSLRDYIHTDGSLGYFQHAFNVYDREGEACQNVGCQGIVRRIVQSGRSTFYCSQCQR